MGGVMYKILKTNYHLNTQKKYKTNNNIDFETPTNNQICRLDNNFFDIEPNPNKFSDTYKELINLIQTKSYFENGICINPDDETNLKWYIVDNIPVKININSYLLCWKHKSGTEWYESNVSIKLILQLNGV